MYISFFSLAANVTLSKWSWNLYVSLSIVLISLSVSFLSSRIPANEAAEKTTFRICRPLSRSHHL